MIRARTPGTSDPSLLPDGATMHSELLRQSGDANAVGAGCSHSVHFLVGQRCSSASPWLRRRRDECAIGLAHGLGCNPKLLNPRGNKPLNPLSPVPVAFDGVHLSIQHQQRHLPCKGAALRLSRCASGATCRCRGFESLCAHLSIQHQQRHLPCKGAALRLSRCASSNMRRF